MESVKGQSHCHKEWPSRVDVRNAEFIIEAVNNSGEKIDLWLDLGWYVMCVKVLHRFIH